MPHDLAASRGRDRAAGRRASARRRCRPGPRACSPARARRRAGSRRGRFARGRCRRPGRGPRPTPCRPSESRVTIRSEATARPDVPETERPSPRHLEADRARSREDRGAAGDSVAGGPSHCGHGASSRSTWQGRAEQRARERDRRVLPSSLHLGAGGRRRLGGPAPPSPRCCGRTRGRPRSLVRCSTAHPRSSTAASATER